VDYRIRRTKSELESTGYIEIGPGRYSGNHWQSGFLFVWEDAFSMAEGIVAKHFTQYDHMAPNDVPAEIGRKITLEWRAVAQQLPTMSVEQAQAALNLAASYREGLDQELHIHKAEIARMLSELADACDGFYSRDKWVCILGV
jgi:hypothetical protein